MRTLTIAAALVASAAPALAQRPDWREIGKPYIAGTPTPTQGTAAPATTAPAVTTGLQDRFVAAATRARTAYKSASNDFGRGSQRPARARELCAIVPGGNVIGWRGQLVTLSTNNDGRGVLAVRIGPNVTLKTWNNAVSDSGDGTLVQPGSALYQKLGTLSVGQRVIISGHLRSSRDDCWRETSMTLEGSMTDPEFLLRFTDIQPE
jgi:hypothetical protein